MIDRDPNAAVSGPLVVIGGPTASGKSPLALALAEEVGGEIINGDSMQVYDELRILTARPDPDDERRVPHHLYGFLPADRRCSVGIWLEAARHVARDCLARDRLPIVVGGTGFYLNTIIRGISPIPDVPEAVREGVVRQARNLSSDELHGLASSIDPELASRIPVGDTQRLMRLIEVHEATGQTLSFWQRQPRQDAWAGPVLYLVVNPQRAELYAVCDARFDAMMAAGALDEVRAFTALGLPRDRPAMRALGVPHLIAHLNGETDLVEAVQLAKAATRHYAKRQVTWFRHQAADAVFLGAMDGSARLAEPRSA